MTGEKLFNYNNGELEFTLSPIIQSDFFDDNNMVSTTILGKIELTYINNSRKNTFGANKGTVEEIIITNLDGEIIKVNGNIVKGDIVKEIRNGNIKKIEAYIK